MKIIFKVFRENKEEFLLFSLMGILAFILDGLICQILITIIGLSPNIARVISLFTAMNFSWLMNRKHTFKAFYKKKFIEWVLFIALISIGNAINYFTFLYSIKILGTSQLNIWASVVAGSLSGLFFNFTSAKFLYKFFLKKPKSKLS